MFEEFPNVSREEWLARLERDLKGKPIEDLNWQLDEELVIPPFYHESDADKNWQPISTETSTNDWEISEDIIVTDNPEEANALALKALEYGANSLRFHLKNGISYDVLRVLIKDINLEYISIHFRIFRSHQFDVVKNFYTVVNNQMDPMKVRGSLSWDLEDDQGKGTLIDDMQLINKFMPNFKLLTVDAIDLSVKVEDTTKTLAETLRRGVSLFNSFVEDGFSKKEVQNHIQFSVPIGKSYFVEIAKIRALKKLWGNVLSAYEVENVFPPTIEIHFSKLEQTEDTHTNMIHATTQAMSAVIAGVDRLTIMPADESGSGFSRRIARNVQHVLKMESFMDRVHDPAAGSYYVEKLTEQLGAKAWEIFQQ